MKRWLLAAALFFAARSAGAAHRVVVLEPSSASAFAWPSGERAVVAELMASDAELVLRPSQATNAELLEREVIQAAAEPGTVGAVGVGRKGSVGFALVALHAGRAPVRIEDDTRQGPVADGAVALRVSEVLRVRTFDLPPEETPVAPIPRTRAAELDPLWPWLSVAVVAARGASSVAPALAFGLRVPLAPWVSLEPSGTFTLGTLRIETTAGDVALSSRVATLELVVAPTDGRALCAGVAAGGGLAWVSGVPRASAGYVGTEASAEAAVLALRGFGSFRHRRLRLMAFAEASALLPAVTVHASGTEVASVGQPWLVAGLAVGYSP